MSTERERQRDTVNRVCAEVMGWERHIYGWRDPVSGTMYIEADEPEHRLFIPWNPLESASSDYMVLEHVRQTWAWGDAESQGSCFLMYLYADLFYRLYPDDFAGSEEDFEVIRAYRPGDYATAALAALDAHKETPQ